MGPFSSIFPLQQSSVPTRRTSVGTKLERTGDPTLVSIRHDHGMIFQAERMKGLTCDLFFHSCISHTFACVTYVYPPIPFLPKSPKQTKTDRTRDLVRMANAYYDTRGVSPEQRADDLNHVALCTWAFVRSMKRHLSPAEEDETNFQVELYEKLPKQQAEMIISAAHRPNRALQDLSFAIDDLPMHFIRKNAIHHSVTQFEDNLGSSERILTSPVPLFYSRHLARFLATWMFLLPFALYDAFSSSWNHTGMIPAMTVIAIMLFGIEEIGTQLEEPFTVLPMQPFCDKIYNWCMEISSWAPGDNGRALQPIEPQHAYFVNGGVSNPASSYANPPRSTLPVSGGPPRPVEMAPAPTSANGSFEEFLKAQGQGFN